MNRSNTNFFWAVDAKELLSDLDSASAGLSEPEAAQRLATFGPNQIKPKRRSGTITLWLAQFKSPIIILLLLAAGLSFFLRDPADAVIILVIVLLSGLLGLWQERRATRAVEQLLALVQTKAMVRREHKEYEVPIEQVVPGDVVVFNAGDIIPGDGLLLTSKNLFVDEATLTGETYPVEKSPGLVGRDAPLRQRTNTLFMGTHVVSGTATAVMVRTGAETEFGKISERLKLRPGETEFEHGVRRFGYLLMEITLLLVIAIFAINVFLQRTVLESFLFALALAVGLTPQLLPAIISVNLAHGARRLAGMRVIVKRLAAIENFGSMTILCADKTGTLTEGVVELHHATGIDGAPSEKVLKYASLNAAFQTGYTNPIDEAILAHGKPPLETWEKLDEEPYDFVRRRMSVLIASGEERLIVTKGAVPNVLSVCSLADTSGRSPAEIRDTRATIENHFEEFCSQGFRVVALAVRAVPGAQHMARADEANMTFLGFLLFSDPLRPGIVETLDGLRNLGITLKIITGDNRLAAANVSRQAGLLNPRVLTGDDLRAMSTAALIQKANDVDLFAEVEPGQKERIIVALRKSGQVVGYMGDGINDASALHSADIGISVANAVDVVKEAADIVLLDKDLAVLARGVQEGRRTFANTLKYVFMATSANFGNMFSMAGASVFLPFLPLLPKQILLLNLLTDLPEMAIATDRVDREWTDHPRRWDLKFIRKFMLTFGLISSVFDFLTFGMLILLLRASPEQFRTGWFLESVVSASLVVLVVRTRKPLHQSRPARSLLMATLLVIAVAAILPLTPLARLFGFLPLQPAVIVTITIIVLAYILVAELAKKVFYKSRQPHTDKSLSDLLTDEH